MYWLRLREKGAEPINRDASRNMFLKHCKRLLLWTLFGLASITILPVFSSSKPIQIRVGILSKHRLNELKLNFESATLYVSGRREKIQKNLHVFSTQKNLRLKTAGEEILAPSAIL